MRNLCHTRFGNQYVWAENEYEDAPSFARFLESFREPSDAEVEEVQRRLQPIGYQTYYDEKFQRDIQWRRILYLCAYEIARYTYGRLRGYQFTRHGYLPTANMGIYVKQRRHWKYLNRPGMKSAGDLDALRGRYKLVYYPMQMDPEASIYGPLAGPQRPDGHRARTRLAPAG